MTEPAASSDLLTLTAQIVAAHVCSTTIAADALPDLIRSVHQALGDAGTITSAPARAEPAVPINHSVFADYIICLEDASKLSMLKRCLRVAYGVTPEQYREK
jgi:predicted transcriptional regulator